MSAIRVAPFESAGVPPVNCRRNHRGTRDAQREVDIMPHPDTAY